MAYLLLFHSHMRWLIVLIALLALIKLAVGWLRGAKFGTLDSGLVAGFSGLMDLQATLGAVLLIWNGLAGTGFPMYRIEHAVTMVLAAGVVHLRSRWKKADDQTRFRNFLLLILLSLVLVWAGVARLPGGWSR